MLGSWQWRAMCSEMKPRYPSAFRSGEAESVSLSPNSLYWSPGLSLKITTCVKPSGAFLAPPPRQSKIFHIAFLRMENWEYWAKKAKEGTPTQLGLCGIQTKFAWQEVGLNGN